ncbi:uncharacterized protein LOC129909456 [Episyrphus balteatus]|uniref:uncharacterized protein LOC129909456 n=1 Tax=Episyrphus balteatus TaxID=286459 RepID=UPI0024857E85|nr:uncharacterized protein LOC129909456 [Episyrphus balteatus]
MSHNSRSRSNGLGSAIHNAQNSDSEGFNCKRCTEPDSKSPMVQCGTCKDWFHFTCVGVTQAVEEIDWHCRECIKEMKRQNGGASTSKINTLAANDAIVAIDDSTQRNMNSTEVPPKEKSTSGNIPPPKQCTVLSTKSSTSTSKSKRIKIKLLKLEEERKLEKKYLEQKYAILEELDSEDDDVSLTTSSDNLSRVQEWIQKTNKDKRTDLGVEVNSVYKNRAGVGVATSLGQNEDDKRKDLGVERRLAPNLNKSQIASRQFMSKEHINFTGRPEEWPLFISWWKNTSEACGFNRNENMLRLQRCLKGKALEAVQYRLLHPDQIELVIKTLQMLFGRPEIIIQSLITKIRSEPAPRFDKLETLINFSLGIDNMCRMMEVTDLAAHLNNPCLLQELVEKLPAQIKLNWGLYKQSVSCVDLSVFNNWLSSYATAASEVTYTVPQSFENKINKKTKAFINVHQDEKPQSKEENKCISCDNNCKSLAICTNFSKLPLSEKWKLVKRFYVCRTCLRRHGSRRCLSSQLCGVSGCTFRHNALLHNDEIQLKVEPNSGDSRTNQPRAISSVENAHYSGTTLRPGTMLTLFKIVPVRLHFNEKSIETFAFIDDGSSVTLIDEELAFSLEASGTKEPLCLRWTANTHRREETSMKITFEISAGDSNKKYLLTNAHTVRSLDLPRQSLDFNSLTQRFSYLNGLPIKSYSNAKPQILLGLQHWRLGMPLKTREGEESQPAAIKTRLGWTLYGVASNEDTSEEGLIANINIHLCDCQNQIDSQMHEAVKKYFLLENLGTKVTKPNLSDEDNKAIRLLEEKTVFLGDSYAVPLLWKYEHLRLPDTKVMAERRLRCLEKRLSNQPELIEQVEKQIEQYLQKGYAKKLNEDEVNKPMSRVWYLPIFPVTNPNKPDKLRIVWDAAAKVGGVSLNACLKTGPDNVPSLPSILFRFRERKVAISADIREMFHQVKILEEDKDSQRFLWRNKNNGNVEVYQMQVMTFGSTCSPFCAQFIKNKNAKIYESQLSRAAKAIIENHYVDDLLDSVDTEEEAIALAKDVIYIHKQAGFEIRNFISNSANVLNALQSNVTKSFKTFSENAQNDFEKLLGMWWSPGADVFAYTFKSNKLRSDIMNGEQVPTKREVLRALMCIFDPLGLIANFTIHLKIILQEIWRSAVDWDEPIKERQFQKWKSWLKLIPNIKNISIDRKYLTNLQFGEGSRVELHIFVDAGEEAMAAVAYMRVSTEDEVECSLISAKTKVAPIKTLSIPRLELEAALMGVRLSKFIQSSHTIKFDSVTFWTDSQVVISWIKSTNKKFKSFVAIRIGEILETSNANEWNWVSTKNNVADDASKIKTNCEFSSSSRWYKGPKFLYQNPLPLEIEHPVLSPDNEGAEEIKECFMHCTTTSPLVLDSNQCSGWTRFLKPIMYIYHFIKLFVKKCQKPEEIKECLMHQTTTPPLVIDVYRFSRWKSLLKTMIYVYRFVRLFVKKWRKPNVLYEINEFQLDEKEAAKNYLFRICQREGFPFEYEALVTKKVSGEEASINKASSLYKLSPYLDENQIIRISGRIDEISNVPFETKRPIILPKDHKITHLVIHECHLRFHHLFNETVVNELRRDYYIPNLRRILKKVQQQCQHCKNNRTKPLPPRMASLPYARLQPFQRPFSYTGVDYFGPLYVKVGRRLEKRWGMLLTCLTLRAIHIEIVYSLSSDSCILGFKRFISRRGMPKEVYSDNGTNFRGASKELQQAIHDLNEHVLAKEFELDLKWNFIPPAAPHMGGCWERMVRSVKQTLVEICPTRNPSDELLMSMMTEIESIVNSRPLSYVPIDSESCEALTPNHLLVGYANQENLYQPCVDDGAAIKKNWLAAEKYAQTFWRRWVREYLPDLTRRTKWFSPQKSLQIGDIVVIVDQNNPRKSWPKGKVLQVMPGKDGTIRSAIVQTQTGIYTRPVVKLAVLDVHKFKAIGKLDPDPVTGGGVLSELGITA